MKVKGKLALDPKEWHRGYHDGLNGINAIGGLSYWSGKLEGKAQRKAGDACAPLRSPASISGKGAVHG